MLLQVARSLFRTNFAKRKARFSDMNVAINKGFVQSEVIFGKRLAASGVRSSRHSRNSER